MLQEVKLKAFTSLLSVNGMDFSASFLLMIVLDAPAFLFMAEPFPSFLQCIFSISYSKQDCLCFYSTAKIRNFLCFKGYLIILLHLQTTGMEALRRICKYYKIQSSTAGILNLK